MAQERKLSLQQERTLTLGYLCGVKSERLQEGYDVSDATIRQNIIGRRSKEWQDSLVEHYRANGDRDTNAAHLYLSFTESPLGDPEVPSFKTMAAYHLVKQERFDPALDAIVRNTSLNRYADRNTPYDRFVENLVPLQTPFEIAQERLVGTLQERYHAEERLSLNEVFSETEQRIIDAVRDGGLGWPDEKKRLIDEKLAGLDDRDASVLYYRFGLEGEPLTLAEIGQVFSVSIERVRNIESRALAKLRAERDYFVPFAGLATTQALYGALAASAMPEAAVDNASDGSADLDDLELSVRARNALRRGAIGTIEELTALTPDQLLKRESLGKKTLREIEEALKKQGNSLLNPTKSL